jgi:predicted ArsR family transcriptional regulator
MSAAAERQTSAEARGSLERDLPRLRRMVLGAIRQAGGWGLSADQVAARLGVSPLSTRPRCTELVQAGRIRDSGRRTRNDSGRQAIVWVAVEEKGDAG